MPYYKPKIERIMYDPEFDQLMIQRSFIKSEHRGFIVLLYLSGIRCSEATHLKRNQFKRVPNKLYLDVGKRLKGSKSTPFLIFPFDAPHIQQLIACLDSKLKDEIVFPYSRKTAYNIVSRFFAYPHYYRMNRITRFAMDGYKLPELKAWTGLTAKSLDYYIAMATVNLMGSSLSRSNISQPLIEIADTIPE